MNLHTAVLLSSTLFMLVGISTNCALSPWVEKKRQNMWQKSRLLVSGGTELQKGKSFLEQEVLPQLQAFAQDPLLTLESFNSIQYFLSKAPHLGNLVLEGPYQNNHRIFYPLWRMLIDMRQKPLAFTYQNSLSADDIDLKASLIAVNARNLLLILLSNNTFKPFHVEDITPYTVRQGIHDVEVYGAFSFSFRFGTYSRFCEVLARYNTCIIETPRSTDIPLEILRSLDAYASNDYSLKHSLNAFLHMSYDWLCLYMAQENRVNGSECVSPLPAINCSKKVWGFIRDKFVLEGCGGWPPLLTYDENRQQLSAGLPRRNVCDAITTSHITNYSPPLITTYVERYKASWGGEQKDAAFVCRGASPQEAYFDFEENFYEDSSDDEPFDSTHLDLEEV